MAQNVFKGFRQVVAPYTTFENGYVYFVRTDEGKEDGYVYFNGKKYGTAKRIESLLGALPDGYPTFAAYIAALASDIGTAKADILNEVSARTAADEALDARIDALTASTHTHNNKAVLDGITSEKVTAWDAAEQNAKDYADGLDEAMDARMDAVEASAHTHDNKTVLDGITSAKVTAWDAAEQNAKDYADDVHTAITAEIATAKAEAISSSVVGVEIVATPTEGYAKTYDVKQGGVSVGKIDIPKDMVVESGEIVTVNDVKYLRLHIANSDNYVDVSIADLAHVYTQGNGIEISGADVISVKVVNANGLSLDSNGIAMGLANASNNGAMSSADFSKLAGIEDNAQKNVQADWNQTDNSKDDFIKNKPENLVEDEDYKHITVTETSVSDGTNTFEKYDDTELAGRVSNIEGDYLKAADKTSLQTAINNEATARTAADEALDARIDALEALTGNTATKSDVATAKSEAIAAASAYTDSKVAALTATVTGSSNDMQITVTETNGVLTAATATAKISTAADNALQSTSDGLFAAIYYEDLDA